MPYRGKSYGRRRRPMRRRRKQFRRRGGHMTAYRVRRLIDAELKFFVTGVETDITPTTGELVSITSNIIQGDLASQRTGNWIKPVNLHGTVVVKGNAAALPGTDTFLVRCGFISWYNDEQFDAPSIGQIMQDPLAPFGPLDIANRGSFKQVWSRKFLISNDIANNNFYRTLPYYLKLHVPKPVYNAGNPKKYQLFFYILTDSIVLDNPTFNLDVTMRYTDS